MLPLSPRGLAHLSSPAGHACSPSLVPGLHFCIYCCVLCICIYSWTSVVFCSPCLRVRCRIGWRSEIRIPGPTKAASSYSLPNPWEPGQSQDRPDNQAGFPTEARPHLPPLAWPQGGWALASSLSSALAGVLHSTQRPEVTQACLLAGMSRLGSSGHCWWRLPQLTPGPAFPAQPGCNGPES